MPEPVKDDALAFIQAMRLTLEGKVGFKWMVEKLAGLASYIESIESENTRLNGFLDSSGPREEYEHYRETHGPESHQAT